MESLPRLYSAPVDVPGERRMRPLRDGGKTGGGAATSFSIAQHQPLTFTTARKTQLELSKIGAGVN
jgi:hypothetical protein